MSRTPNVSPTSQEITITQQNILLYSFYTLIITDLTSIQPGSFEVIIYCGYSGQFANNIQLYIKLFIVDSNLSISTILYDGTNAAKTITSRNSCFRNKAI
jgi:hypothetical protein